MTSSANGIRGLLAACLPLAALAAEPAGPPEGLVGFSAQSAHAQGDLEQRFDAELSAPDLRAWMQRLASAPNHVGSAHDRANAEFILQQFRDWGWDAAIERFSTLYPTPLEERLELVEPTRFVAALREPPVAGDATSTQTEGLLPPYNVYGADGDVTAELVYVNQGMPDDYRELERQGIDVKGRIVIARYGGGWRGLKPKLAFEHGAVGCLIYSDPRDDGYGAGDTYPKGGYRPKDAVQRGSVQDLTLYSGDPLTPGVGATPQAKRLALADAKTILKIPVLPISYADAEPLLAALGGRVAPPSWRGGLPLTYHVGPGPAVVHLKVRSDWSQKIIYDVIAKIAGREEPDHWIIRGNHHDAWVFGAADPLSGHVAMMAEAKAIGRLVRQGWRPRRTLVYASWDGEEPGLLGSTEWVEAHADELAQKAALYVNSDMNSRGTLDVEGSHSLQSFINQVARDVKDPETGASTLARALAVRRVAVHEAGHADGGGTDAGRADTGRAELQLGALGSGSDFTPFLQHLGINAVNLEFHGEADYGVYHSAYDSFDHFTRFVDPTFQYGVALAQTAGRVVLRAAQADVLPARQSDFASTLAGYDEELHRLLEASRTSAVELEQLLRDGAYGLADDPRALRAAPVAPGVVPAVNFLPLDAAIERLRASAKAFDAYYAQLTSSGSKAERARVNAMLTSLERSLTDHDGLPGREWYRHMIYAPGLHTGYGVKTLPGIREALEERRWDEANRYIGVVAGVLNAYSAKLAEAMEARAGGT